MSSKKTKASPYIKLKIRRGVEYWGYDVWLRQPNGRRKRYRDFTFTSKGAAQQALAALRTTGWKTRYAVNPPEEKTETTIREAVQSYLNLKQADLLASKSNDTTYWRDMPGHLRTLERWCQYIGPDKPVRLVTKDDFIFWIAAETERGRLNKNPIKKSTIKRGLNTIRAALNHAVQNTAKFPDLNTYQVPKSPLTKKVEEERDRVLTDEEIGQICEALAERPEWEEALFFFQLDLITGARMAELLRMRWEESSIRFGTVKLYSSKPRSGAPSKHPPPPPFWQREKLQVWVVLTWFLRIQIIGIGTYSRRSRRALEFGMVREYLVDGLFTTFATRA